MHLNDAFGLHASFKKIYCHHEQACAMAAEAFGRFGGVPAVVNVTTSPGGINALNGVFGAYTDSVPMIVVSGQVKRETLIATSPLPIRQVGDQEVNIVQIVKQGLTKAAVQLENPANAAAIVKQAWEIATTGRAGPVWIDVPMDIQSAPVPERAPEADDDLQFDSFNTPNTGMEDDAATGAALASAAASVLSDLMAARRPVIFAGGGVRAADAMKEYLELAERLDCPFVTGWNAHDILPNDHKNYSGRPSSVGDRAGNFTIQNADYVLVLGSHLNIRQISYNFRAEEAVSRSDHVDYLAWCRRRVSRYPTVLPEYRGNPGGKVNPYYFVEKLFAKLPPDAHVVCGDGAACVVTFQAAIIKQQTRLFSNSGSASMGCDLPAALGVAVATGRRTYCIAGDGSIMTNIQELQTLSARGSDVVVFLLNNDGYHSIRQTQQNYFPENISGCGPDSGLYFPRYEEVAGAFGFTYQRIDLNGDVSSGLDLVLKSKGPIICEIMLDKEQDFSPKLTSKKLADGTMVTSDFADLWPLLPADELQQNIIED
jgi:acetolactate synthase-1/2/3 large subunit